MKTQNTNIRIVGQLDKSMTSHIAKSGMTDIGIYLDTFKDCVRFSNKTPTLNPVIVTKTDDMVSIMQLMSATATDPNKHRQMQIQNQQSLPNPKQVYDQRRMSEKIISEKRRLAQIPYN